MAGTAAPPPPLGEKAINSFLGNNEGSPALSASNVNFFRINTCCDRLALHVRAAPKNDPVEFFNLCLSLARGIDYSVANKEVPDRVHELPLLMKKVCRLRNDSFQQTAVLVLMISIKNACQSQWFLDQDSQELCSLANEILSSFCSSMDFNTEPNSFNSTISTIMSRYYPRMKMGEVLAFIEVKPGYGTYVRDFQITKGIKCSQDERIRLFIAQTDNTETSSCLITPIEGNFLLNGKPVERRHNAYMDPGPQMPTLVSNFLKYGTNLLQVVGQFHGHYVTVIAFMSMVSAPDHSELQDYVQATLSMVDSDSEIIEGPSRISLNCPISFKRINVPVKGHMCKHLQCFDYYNYMEINSRRPSWRCPHCNQHVCFTDIRIDQNMVKVLKEIGETVSDVIISSDGSWKAIMESDDPCDKPQDKKTIPEQTETVQLEASGDPPGDIMDLTVDDYDMDTLEMRGTEDNKVSSSQANGQNMAVLWHINNTNKTNQNSAMQIEDDFWTQIGDLNNMLSPVLTDGSTSVLDHEVGPSQGNALVATSISQSENSFLNPLQLHQFQGNATPSNEYGRSTSIPRHVSRTPVAVQALPVPSPTSSLQQRPKNHMMLQNSLLIPQTSGEALMSVPGNMDRQQQFSRAHLNPLQGPHVASSRLQQHPLSQNLGLQTPSQVQSSYRVPTVFRTDHVNSSQQATLNMRASMNQSLGMMRPSATPSRPQSHQGGPQTIVGSQQAPGMTRPSATSSRPQSLQGGPPPIVGSQQARSLATSRTAMMGRPVQTSRAPSPYLKNTDGARTSMGGHRESMAPPPMRTEVPMDMTPEQNWRPAGRMRGSLSGKAYSEAYNQYITRPSQQAQASTQQAQATAPSPNTNSVSRSPSSQLDILMANRAALAQVGNLPFTGSINSSSDLPQ